MEIYIDESGVFKPSSKEHDVSCVVALIVPESIRPLLFEAIAKWFASPYLSHKQNKQGEIKGSSLGEQEYVSFLKILAQFDVLVEVVSIDMGMTSDDLITWHKGRWPAKEAGDKTPYDPSKLLALSNQLYAQMYGLFTLIHQVMKIAIPYYVQRLPQELGNFEWIIDAKGSTSITTYESVFAWMIMPVLQSISRRDPMAVVDGFDYSVFDSRYAIKQGDSGKWPQYTNITALMEQMRFEVSHTNIGLQAADIIASCVRRGMVGHLQFDGWKYLEKLVVHRKDQAISVQRFSDGPSHGSAPYGGFVNHFQKYGKNMILRSSW